MALKTEAPGHTIPADDDHCGYSDDDELPIESVQDMLSWRKDYSFSDWTIIITSTASNTACSRKQGRYFHLQRPLNSNGHCSSTQRIFRLTL
jgi:hypothetical protein